MKLVREIEIHESAKLAKLSEEAQVYDAPTGGNLIPFSFDKDDDAIPDIYEGWHQKSDGTRTEVVFYIDGGWQQERDPRS